MKNPSSKLQAPSSRVAVYPGTFDPITYGHMDIVKRALHVADNLIIAVAEATMKSPLFNLKERTAMVQAEVDALKEKKSIQVLPFTGLLAEFAYKQHADVIIRGLRAVSDFEYEFQMACMNTKLRPEVQTIFLPASEQTQFISSRFVKEIARLGGNVSELVSAQVSRNIAKKLKI